MLAELQLKWDTALAEHLKQAENDFENAHEYEGLALAQLENAMEIIEAHRDGRTWEPEW